MKKYSIGQPPDYKGISDVGEILPHERPCAAIKMVCLHPSTDVPRLGSRQHGAAEDGENQNLPPRRRTNDWDIALSPK